MKTHLLIIEKDKKVSESIQKFAVKNNIKGAFLQGLGAIKDFELGFYHLEKKEYERKWFKGHDYELLSLNGNIAIKDGQPFVHIHASVGAEDFKVYGGHVFEATVAVTVEIGITETDTIPTRLFDDCTGLYLIQKQESKK